MLLFCAPVEPRAIRRARVFARIAVWVLNVFVPRRATPRDPVGQHSGLVDLCEWREADWRRHCQETHPPAPLNVGPLGRVPDTGNCVAQLCRQRNQLLELVGDGLLEQGQSSAHPSTWLVCQTCLMRLDSGAVGFSGGTYPTPRAQHWLERDAAATTLPANFYECSAQATSTAILQQLFFEMQQHPLMRPFVALSHA